MRFSKSVKVYPILPYQLIPKSAVPNFRAGQTFGKSVRRSLPYQLIPDLANMQSRRSVADPLSSRVDGHDLPELKWTRTSPADPLGSCDGAEWRDQANLGIELIEDITGRLLALNLAEYIRFRASCKPWSDCTDDPRARRNGLPLPPS